jgi:hypothetical protein
MLARTNAGLSATSFKNFSSVRRNLTVMENRKVRRRRVFKAALIQLPGGAVSCVVRDLSETGALLQVPSQLGIPHEFSLRIPTAELDRPCRAVWRSAKGIGIAFVSGKSALS